MELRDLKEKVYNSVHGGNTLIIEFYKGTQQEDMDGSSYDDDNWYIYEKETNTYGKDDERLHECYGDYLEQILEMYLKKKGDL